MNKNILIGILVFLLVGCSSFIFYDKVLKKENSTELVNSDELIEEDVEESFSDSELDILGRSLYSMTKYKDSGYLYFYENNNLNYNNMDNTYKLEMAFNRANNIKNYFLDDDCYDELGQAICYELSVSKEDFEVSYKNIFGNDKDIKYENFTFLIDGVFECKLENNQVNCYPIDGGDIKTYEEYIEYDQTEMVDEDIIIYVKYLRHVNDNNLYTDSEETTKIATVETENNLMEKYRDKAGIYKLTFKKDNINNYYWYSTKRVS